MTALTDKKIRRRRTGENVWLSAAPPGAAALFARQPVPPYRYEVLKSEAAIGRAMLDELEAAARAKAGDLAVLLLGGRGAQAMYRLICEKAAGEELDDLLGRLHVFTQDALAPLRMDNDFSFVRDFERLLGEDFFRKVKSFTPMRTDTGDPEGALAEYLEKLASLGGIDLFFLGLGPEAGAASHLAYIKPNSGAAFGDLAGVVPISASILEHHVGKFKAGGSGAKAEDEAECRAATHIMTLGPAAILGARRVVQSIVDAASAPDKKPSFRRVLETEIAADPLERARQMDENPGLWLRLHPNVRALILPDLLEA